MIDITDHATRHEYMGKRLRMEIAYQARLLRIQKLLTFEEAAKLCDLDDATIRRIEDWDAEFPSVATLLKLGAGYDVALLVRFNGWEEVIASLIPDYKAESGADAQGNTLP